MGCQASDRGWVAFSLGHKLWRPIFKYLTICLAGLRKYELPDHTYAYEYFQSAKSVKLSMVPVNTMALTNVLCGVPSFFPKVKNESCLLCTLVEGETLWNSSGGVTFLSVERTHLGKSWRCRVKNCP